MKLVIIESPYAGAVEENQAYARKAMLDSLLRGESPYLSHLLITQVLDDDDQDQRRKGILAGHAWYKGADIVAFYYDLGITDGMAQAEDAVNAENIRRKAHNRKPLMVERRSLYDTPASKGEISDKYRNAARLRNPHVWETIFTTWGMDEELDEFLCVKYGLTVGHFVSMHETWKAYQSSVSTSS